MYNKIILIMLNVLWDFICGSSLILNIKPFTKPHNSLWINKNPDNNLFGYLIISWGLMRYYGVKNDLKELISISYIYEGLIVLNEIFINKRIKIVNGLFVSLSSFIIVFIIN